MNNEPRSRPSALVRATSRLSPIAFYTAILFFASSYLVEIPPVAKQMPDVVIDVVSPLISLAGLVFIVLAVVGYLAPRPTQTSPRPVLAPVRGRWLALNSPASKVPSHHMHTNGQTYAIDVVYGPHSVKRPAFGAGSLMRSPSDYPAFGQSVHAPAAGTILVASDNARDHLARTSWPGVIYMMIEGVFREILGAGKIFGNHIIIDLHDGSYACLAHLQKGSTTVKAGDTVQAGQIIAACGNSGSSSEPHVHFQLMDHPRPTFAAGLPFVFTNSENELPPNGAFFETTSTEPFAR